MAQERCFFIFHGQDEFTQRETLAELRTSLGDPAMVELNTSTFDGRSVRLEELQNACRAFPFLADKRLVIVEGLLERIGGRGRERERDTLLDFLPELPPTTRLVFLERETLPVRNRFIQLAKESPIGFEKAFDVPSGPMLERWIQKRVETLGGTIHPHAAALLASNAGDTGSLRLLETEIEKLLAYTKLERPIQAADVDLLTPYATQAGIFELVDAIGQRRAKRASSLLQEKLEAGEDPFYLFSMITRQIRLLIQVKEKSEQGLWQNDIGRAINQSSFIVGKLYPQTRNFELAQLEEIHRQLLDIDVAIKTGRTTPVVALELLVTELTG